LAPKAEANQNKFYRPLDGEDEYSEVKIIRIFPISDPWHFICFKGIEIGAEKGSEETKCDADSSHKELKPRPKEIGIIRDVRQLEVQSRRFLEQELEMIYFTPKITCINRIKSERGIHQWDVETDRGSRILEIRHRENLRIIPPGRVIIKDVDGNRFEIPDYRKLNAKSRSLLEKHL
jgi:hypothetical protein